MERRVRSKFVFPSLLVLLIWAYCIPLIAHNPFDRNVVYALAAGAVIGMATITIQRKIETGKRRSSEKSPETLKTFP